MKNFIHSKYVNKLPLRQYFCNKQCLSYTINYDIVKILPNLFVILNFTSRIGLIMFGKCTKYLLYYFYNFSLNSGYFFNVIVNVKDLYLNIDIFAYAKFYRNIFPYYRECKNNSPMDTYVSINKD